MVIRQLIIKLLDMDSVSTQLRDIYPVIMSCSVITQHIEDHPDFFKLLAGDICCNARCCTRMYIHTHIMTLITCIDT